MKSAKTPKTAMSILKVPMRWTPCSGIVRFVFIRNAVHACGGEWYRLASHDVDTVEFLTRRFGSKIEVVGRVDVKREDRDDPRLPTGSAYRVQSTSRRERPWIASVYEMTESEVPKFQRWNGIACAVDVR